MSLEDPAGFGAHLDDLSLNSRLYNGTPSERADITRSLLVHLYHARANGSISDAALNEAQSPYWELYQGVVDNFDEQEGLNNFAEGALALCNLHRNESQSWKSSLTADKFFSSARGKHFQKLCQLSVENEKAGVQDEVVKVRTDFKVPCVGNMEMETVGLRPDLSHQHGASDNVGQRSDSSNQNGSNPVTCRSNGPGYSHSGRGSGWSSSTSETTRGFMPNDNNNLHNVRRTEWPGNQPQGTVITDSGQFGNTPRFPNPQQNRAQQSNPSGAFAGRQNNFLFKKSFGSCRNELPYDLPAGWDDPGPTSEFVTGQPGHCTAFQRNRSGFCGDQEVPRKPLFSSAGTGGGPVRPDAQPRTVQNFYRRTEPNRDGPDVEEEESCMGPFKTAKEQLSINQQKKYGQTRGPVKPAAYGNVKKSLGTRRGPSSKFVPPVVSRDENGDRCGGDSDLLLRKAGPGKVPPGDDEIQDERLKGLEPKMIELIMNEIMDHGAPVGWDDIAGLDFAKKTIKEIVVWPMLRPDIFTGLRGPPKGLLLFGPPGTGKTLIGKCIASQSKSTFFSISASSLTSKWVGEGEKMVKSLFAVSRCHQPAVIFIDEIDSLLSQRTDGEHEASRRIKTEFLVQLDGATTESDERLLVIGATNRPQEIDEAARRRFVKRLYIPLPEKHARRQIILNLLSSQRYQLTEEELDIVCQKTDGYSGSDMANLCREAALGPIRSIDFAEIERITADQVRPITFQDFEAAVEQVRASVSAKDLDLYIDWNRLFGCGGK